MKIYRIDREEEAIAEVQRYLRALSYHHASIPHVGVDGIYGEQTREAVRAFQALFALSQTGIVDQETFSRLYREFLTVRRRGMR
ncbi:MAG: peptidoglycan-binding protein [Ruminococcaceae bacterium]|nr:peptidoglycan-binding protein [Oscillospiraceae bacterium]